MAVTVNTTTTITFTDDEHGIEVELPVEPEQYLDPVYDPERREVRFAVYDECPGIDFDFPEGVDFVQGNRNYLHYCDDAQAWIDEQVEQGKTLFPVDVYEHGLISYSLSGTGPQCDFDTARGGACIAIPNDYTNPEEAARGILQDYTDWCNGRVYIVYTVPVDRPYDYEAVGGYIGDYAEQVVNEGE